jgi:sortase A
MGNKLVPVLSQAMLILGGLMILVGLGWGIWTRVNAPPEPTITDAGAVVLAETAPPRPMTLPPSDTPTPSPAPTSTPTQTPAESSPEGLAQSSLEGPAGVGPTPDLLPDWTVTPTSPAPTPTAQAPQPTATPVATSTPMPAAKEPPTRIVAPAINLDAKIVPMGWELLDRNGTMISEWVVPKKAAGWHMNSALPGHQENVVLSGHHNIEGKVFRYVVDLSLGDEITLYVDDIPYTYTVTDKYILKESGMPLATRRKNAQWIMPTGDERLTLVTCWPYEWPGNSHRVIVVARPPDYVDPRQEIIE